MFRPSVCRCFTAESTAPISAAFVFPYCCVCVCEFAASDLYLELAPAVGLSADTGAPKFVGFAFVAPPAALPAALLRKVFTKSPVSLAAIDCGELVAMFCVCCLTRSFACCRDCCCWPMSCMVTLLAR